MVFRDFDPTGCLRPAALESAWPSIGDFLPLLSVSVCVVRKSDVAGKFLHLLTDTDVADRDDDRILFDGPTNIHHVIGSSRFDELRPRQNEDDRDVKAEHDFALYGALWDEGNDFLRGFEQSCAELRLWDNRIDEGQSKDVVLQRWHESKNWV